MLEAVQYGKNVWAAVTYPVCKKSSATKKIQKIYF